HIFQSKTSQTTQRHETLHAAESSVQFPEQLSQNLHDQASLAEHAQFEFAQEVAFPGDSTDQTPDSTLAETQNILQSLKTLLNSQEPQSADLNQTGDSLLGLVARLKQELTAGQATLKSQAAALQNELSST